MEKIKKCPICGKRLKLIKGVYRHKYSLDEVLSEKVCDYIEPVRKNVKQKSEYSSFETLV